MTEYTKTILKSIQNEMSSSLTQMLEESSFEESRGMAKLIQYYKSQREKDGLVSDVVDDIVNELMGYLPVQFLSVSIDDIEIKTENKSGTFNIHLEKAIVAFVKFKVFVNEAPLPATKLRIEIKPAGVFNVKVHVQENKRKICLNSFRGTLSSSILSLPFMRLKEPIVLAKKELAIDFSKLSGKQDVLVPSYS